MGRFFYTKKLKNDTELQWLHSRTAMGLERIV